jgi:hypothetical protein
MQQGIILRSTLPPRKVDKTRALEQLTHLNARAEVLIQRT